MLVLDNGDKIQGDASAATIVDYTLHGMVGSTLTQLADGQLAATKTDIYTASGIVVVSAVTIVNTDTVARTINLYLLPSGGTARRIIAKSMTLEAGFSLHYDGVKVNIVNTTGGIVTSNLMGYGRFWLPAESAYLPATNPMQLVEVAGVTTYGGYSELLADDTTSEHCRYYFPIPDYDGGNITITATGRPATTPGDARTAILNILAIGVASSEDFDTAVTVDTGVDITFNFDTTTLQTDKMDASAVIDPDNVSSGDMMILEFSRNVADTLVGDLKIINFLFEYAKN